MRCAWRSQTDGLAAACSVRVVLDPGHLAVLDRDRREERLSYGNATALATGHRAADHQDPVMGSVHKLIDLDPPVIDRLEPIRDGFQDLVAAPECLRTEEPADSYRVAARYRYIKGLTAFSMRDYSEPRDPNPAWDLHSGILRKDLSPKPAFSRVKSALRRLR
jgi:hypothetical protein